MYYSANEISEAILQQSHNYELPKELVAAIAYQESHGRFHALRVERGFYRRYLANKIAEELPGHVPKEITLETEKWARAVSWGLMQIMGETARENGFKGNWVQIYDPMVNVGLGCRYFKKCLQRDEDVLLKDLPEVKFFKKFSTLIADIKDEKKIRAMMALLRYNGGTNVHYPFEVFSHIDSGKYLKILLPTGNEHEL